MEAGESNPRPVVYTSSPNLQRLIRLLENNWHRLPESIKAALMLLAGATNQTTTHSTSMAFASHPACNHIVNQKSPPKVQPQRSATWLTAPAARRKEENRLTPLPTKTATEKQTPPYFYAQHRITPTKYGFFLDPGDTPIRDVPGA